MGLLDRIAAARSGKDEQRSSVDQWISDYLIPATEQQFTYGGATYPYGLNQTWSGQRIREISQTLPGYAAALRQCPPAFAAQMKRALVLSQARFTFRNPPWHRSTPRRTFGTSALRTLERPWRNATTGELLSRMEWHAGLAGNAYVYRQRANRLRVLRPDYTAILYGSDLEPEDPAHALDGEIIGYIYQNGGIRPDNDAQARTLLPDEVAHWSPIPDPESPGLGMSWVTAALREIQGDRAATEHKLSFFRNGATANMVVSGIPAATKEQFDKIVEAMESRHAGVRNAYRTLYLTAGADAKVVGSDLKQLDFKATQGAGETRIALLGGVPAALLGISEGLAGSALNAGNFGMAKRIFADMWLYPTLQDVSAALAPIVDVPDDAELWFDTVDIPLLREDGKDAADIEQVKASTITSYVREGFTAQSAIDAVGAQDVTLLQHTDLVSVQLQPPGATAQSAVRPASRTRREHRKFNPGQPRDDDGQWIDLSPGDELVGATKKLLSFDEYDRERRTEYDDLFERIEAISDEPDLAGYIEELHAVGAGRGRDDLLRDLHQASVIDDDAIDFAVANNGAFDPRKRQASADANARKTEKQRQVAHSELAEIINDDGTFETLANALYDMGREHGADDLLIDLRDVGMADDAAVDFAVEHNGTVDPRGF